MSVTINSPASGATLKGTVTVTATFVGSRFDIATVTIDGKQVATDSVQPLSFQVDTTKVTDGPHTLTVAVRYATAGGKLRWQKASEPITVANAVDQTWTRIAGEGGSFSLPSTAEVRYGKDTTWVSKTLAPGTYLCGNALFGDPLVGITKECQAHSVSASNVARSAPTQVVVA